MQILKELRQAVDRNAEYCKKKFETIRKNKEIENSFAKMNTKLKAMNSRRNNAEKWICDLKEKIMEINQDSRQKVKLKQTNKQKKMKAI